MGSSRKIKSRPAIEIELTYDDVELIPNLIEEESFTEHILTETYDSISYAVENNLNKIDIHRTIHKKLDSVFKFGLHSLEIKISNR